MCLLGAEFSDVDGEVVVRDQVLPLPNPDWVNRLRVGVNRMWDNCVDVLPESRVKQC